MANNDGANRYHDADSFRVKSIQENEAEESKSDIEETFKKQFINSFGFALLCLSSFINLLLGQV